MQTSLFIGVLCIAAAIASDPVPVVIWHGMGDSCCNPESMGYIKKLIEDNVPGVYVLSLMIGDSTSADVEHGFFMNVNTQVEEVCETLRKDARLASGYNAVGFSQGGQFLRAVAQRCPDPPMRNLISVGGQHQGIFGFPRCPAADWICEAVRRMLDWGAYVSFVQSSIVQAEYWHDPLNEKEYREKSVFLADINNELVYKDAYKQNLLKLNNFLLVMFTQDGMVVPRESEWFGFYQENNDKVLVAMENTTLYTEDRIGLRTLNQSGRLHFLSVDGDHLQISDATFISEIINKFLK
uniref:Palmitoyl-protein thioesterase 1 n=1 Tax=Plectus sambesii TaxID=2011161 RepID=A0A914WAB8_9BILA